MLIYQKENSTIKTVYNKSLSNFVLMNIDEVVHLIIHEFLNMCVYI